MLTQLFPPGFWTHLGMGLAYLTALGLVLRAVGRAFGPTVQKNWPRAYAVLARAGRVALELINDAGGAARELVAEGVLPASAATTKPPPGAS